MRLNHLLTLSKAFNVLLLLCFFLPFMINDCKENNEEATNTTNKISYDDSDSAITIDVAEQEQPNISADSSTTFKDENRTNNKNGFFNKIIKKLSFPTENTISLFGYLISYWLWMFIGISGFIILFVFYLQFFKGNRIHLLVLLIIAEIMLLSIPLSESLSGLRLGYKLIFIIILLMIILEFFIIKKRKNDLLQV